MRVLVTGGAGFIGSHVVDALIGEGHQVAILDNLSTGLLVNVNPAAAFVKADIRDVGTVASLFEGFHPQCVMHHAAQIDVCKSTDDPVFDAESNVLGSLNLLRHAVAHDVEKFIYASSGGAVYGEPEYLPADERHPIRPISEYGVSKHAVEHYLHVYGMNYGLNYTVLRYANVYGPRQNVHGEAGVVAIFTGRMLEQQPVTIYGTGEATRDYVYVGDVAQANLLALTRGDRAVVNIGTGVGASVNTLYQLLAAVTDYDIPPSYAPSRVGEIERTYLANDLAAEVLGWHPQVCLAEGIRRTVDFVRVHA